MRHLVILILHTHKHRLRAPQDTSILSLQGDLAGKARQRPGWPSLFSPMSGPVIPLASTPLVPLGPGPWSSARSQTLDPQQRGPQLPRHGSPTAQSHPQSPQGAVAAVGENRGKGSGSQAWGASTQWPHFICGETEAQRGLALAGSHTASKSQDQHLKPQLFPLYLILPSTSRPPF